MKLYRFNTTKTRYLFFFSLMVLGTWFGGCDRGNRLEKAIERELATGVRNDSLFLGLSFGLKPQEFFDHCWDLNKRGIVKEGMGNMSVEYLFKDSLDQPVAFNFYPELDGTRIHTYKTTFYYYAWAPWHKHLQSSVMLKMLDPILLDWYGGNEVFSQVIDGKRHFYKIDGNRMIDLSILSDREVVAIYTDLEYYRKGDQ